MPAPSVAIAQPAAALEPARVAAQDAASSRRDRSAVPSTTVPWHAAALVRGVSAIAVIDAEPIAVAAIDVPQLESDAPLSIEALTIEELTIEPLAASND